MLLWLQIYRDVGVLSIIIQALFKDIIMFGGILLVVMAAFASAFVALMPSLGDATFGTDGAFALPFWAMFGEFGDLHSIGVAGALLPRPIRVPNHPPPPPPLLFWFLTLPPPILC
jgi:hypothetical protein